jgi:hypothetical protein
MRFDVYAVKVDEEKNKDVVNGSKTISIFYFRVVTVLNQIHDTNQIIDRQECI